MRWVVTISSTDVHAWEWRYCSNDWPDNFGTHVYFFCIYSSIRNLLLICFVAKSLSSFSQVAWATSCPPYRLKFEIMKNINCATLIALLLAFSFSSSTWAKDKKFDFLCGKTKFSLIASPVQEEDGLISSSISKLIISAKLNKEKIRLVYDNNLRKRYEEYFAAGCFKNRERNYFVFQNHCGGSGCPESQFGIIDASSLEILLTPSMPNYEQAKYLLNTDVPELKLIDPIQ